MASQYRVLSLAIVVLAGISGLAGAEPRVEGKTLIMTSRADNVRDRSIEAVPAKVENISEVVYGDWSGEPNRMKVKEIKKLLTRRTSKQVAEGKVEVVCTSYMLIPALEEEIPADKADIGSGFAWSHIETEMIMMNVTDGFLDGKFVGREIEAGWPSVSRTFGMDSYGPRDAARTR